MTIFNTLLSSKLSRGSVKHILFQQRVTVTFSSLLSVAHTNLGESLVTSLNHPTACHQLPTTYSTTPFISHFRKLTYIFFLFSFSVTPLCHFNFSCLSKMKFAKDQDAKQSKASGSTPQKVSTSSKPRTTHANAKEGL